MKKKVIVLLYIIVSVLSFSEPIDRSKLKSIKESTKSNQPLVVNEKKETKKKKSITQPIKKEKVSLVKNNIPKQKKEIIVKEETRPEYRAVLVGDMDGNILYGENISAEYPLASTTKLMTMLLTFEALKKGEVSLDDEVEISWNAARMGGAMIPLKVGQKFRLEELIKATAIHSANNAAYAVGEHVGKGFDNFIKMMNDKAAELGVSSDVEFYTPAGLPTKMTQRGMDVGNAKGMYKLMLEANKYPEYLAIAGTKYARIENETVLLRNKNHLLGKEGIYGLKTGYHVTAGYNILVMGEKSDMSLCYIVFGGRTAKLRDEKVLELDRKIRAEYVKKDVVSNKTPIAEIKIKKGIKERLAVYADRDYSKIVKKTDDVVLKIDRKESIVAPIKENDEVGKYQVFVNGKAVYEGKMIVKEAVEKKGFVDSILGMF